MTQDWGKYSELPCKKRVNRTIVHDVNEKRTMCSSSPQFKDDEKTLSLKAGEAMKTQPAPHWCCTLDSLEAPPPPCIFHQSNLQHKAAAGTTGDTGSSRQHRSGQETIMNTSCCSSLSPPLLALTKAKLFKRIAPLSGGRGSRITLFPW